MWGGDPSGPKQSSPSAYVFHLFVNCIPSLISFSGKLRVKLRLYRRIEMAKITMNDLPTEVIFQILFNIPPSDAISVIMSAKRYHTFLGPTLWRHFCRIKFRFWQEFWNIEAKFKERVEDVDWRGTFLRRQEAELSTEVLLEQIIQGQSGRLSRYEPILAYGFDVKDVLLRHIDVGDDAQDVLARRYHSSLLLNTIHRRAAFKVWESVADGEDIILEKAVIAFEMFLWKERPDGFEDISARLDALTAKLQDVEPNIFDQTPRQKALSLARFLRTQGFRDENKPDTYGDLRNHFIGATLQGSSHSCVPLIVVTIYSCIASRIYLDASLCCVPFHVYAQVRAPPDIDLDGQPCKAGTELGSMYMDPYRSDQEVEYHELISILRTISAPQSMYETVRKTSSIPEILIRAARNIIFSVDILRGRPDRNELLTNQQRNPRDVDGAFYGALGTLLLLSRSVRETDSIVSPIDRTQCIQYLFDLLHQHYPIEILNFQRFARPYFNEVTRPLKHRCDQLMIEDSKPRLQKRRTQTFSAKVLYKVGQVFKHKRYGYRAVIIGWDSKCAAKESWIWQMGVNQLQGGRMQSFYNAM